MKPMKPTKPSQQHADAVRSGAFEGNLRRTSLLPGEVAVRPPASQDIRAAGTGTYAEPAGAVIYRRHLVEKRWPDQEYSHQTSGRGRSWWHWPIVATAVVLAVWGIILATSDSGAALLGH